MSMPDRFSPRCAALVLGAILPFATLAQGQEAPARTFAAPPAPLPDKGEPTPPSPVIEGEIRGTAGVDGQFGVGRPAAEAEIAAIDIDVMPDGRGLPPGKGSYAEGEVLFTERCSACHGENLQGVLEVGGPALIGGRGSLATDKPVKTVESYLAQASTLYDYVYRAMPMDEPGSLSPDQVYALSAYILGQGGILDKDAVLDQHSLPSVAMPNADGFIADPRPDQL